MINHKILIDTAAKYEYCAKSDPRYASPSKILNGAIKQLGIEGRPDETSINNSDQYVVIRIEEISGEQELIRHPLDLIDKGVAASIESLNNRGMLDKERICLIAVPRGSLKGTFTFIYEVVRKSAWSVLPLGGSVDGQDISRLCNTYKVDTLIVAVDAIKSIFTSNAIGQFETVRDLMYVSGTLTQKDLHTIESRFPHFKVCPFIYYSDIAGPIGLPIQGNENDGFNVLENALVEVESAEGKIALNGSGRILISVLGLEQPTLIRRYTGYDGLLTTKDGNQTVRFREGDTA